MADVLNLRVKSGPVVLLLGLIGSIASAVFGFARRDDDASRWLGCSLLGAVGIGIAALFAGTALGMGVFCSSEKMGNLCGLGGVFGSGPFLAGICLASYAYRRVLGASNAP